MKEKTAVQILGITLSLESDLAPLEIHSIAKYVEEKMREAKLNTDIQETSKIALLAALNIADELLKLKSEYQHFSSTVDKKADELISLIDRTLE